MTTPDDHDADARLWDADEQARDIAEEAFDSLLEHVDLRDPVWRQRRVLDVGCGTGLLTAELAPHVGRIIAVDSSPAMLGVLRAKRIANVDVHCADIDNDDLPWLCDFDLIVTSCVCSTLPNYPATMKALAKALNPGGIFAQWDWLTDDPDDDGLSLDHVKSAFKFAGLSCVHVDFSFDALFDDSPLLAGIAMKSPFVL